MFQRGLAFPKIISKGNGGAAWKKFAYIKSAVASATIGQQSIKSYVSVTQRLFRATDAMDDLSIHRHLGAENARKIEGRGDSPIHASCFA